MPAYRNGPVSSNVRPQKRIAVGLKSDFEEVLSVWSRSPWRVRVWLALSLVLASGSIASLSETIAKWKGFILSGLSLYRNSFLLPVRDFLSELFRISIPTELADAIVLCTLLLSANLKLTFSRAGSSTGKEEAIAGAFTLVIFGAAVLIWSSTENVSKYLSSLVLAFLIFASLRFYRIGGTTRLLWFTYILAPVFLVCIAAAINSGLA